MIPGSRERRRLDLSASLASVSVALILVAGKLWTFAATGALSVAASLADSALDLIVSLGGLAAILYAARPPDEDHAFGHSSAEDLAALGQAVFILVSAAAIVWAVVERLAGGTPDALGAENAGIAVMAGSIVLTLGLVAWQRRVAARTGNRVVAADSLHYVGDLIPSVGAIVALWASAHLGLAGIDTVVALGAAAFLGLSALHIGRGAWDALMDRRADPALVAAIGRMAAEWPGVQGYHDLKTRTAGSKVFVNLHIELDGGQSLTQAHDIGAGLRHAILAAWPQTDVIIHKDPVRQPYLGGGETPPAE